MFGGKNRLSKKTGIPGRPIPDHISFIWAVRRLEYLENQARDTCMDFFRLRRNSRNVLITYDTIWLQVMLELHFSKPSCSSVVLYNRSTCFDFCQTRFVNEQVLVITHLSPICWTVGVLAPTLPTCTATLWVQFTEAKMTASTDPNGIKAWKRVAISQLHASHCVTYLKHNGCLFDFSDVCLHGAII